VTGGTSWTPPRFVLRMHMDMIPVIEEQTEPVIKWFLKIGCKRYLLGHFFSDIVLTCDLFRRRRNFIKTQREALPVVQGFGRCVLARRVTVALAKETFRRVYDDETDTNYYFNLITRQSSWTKPTVSPLSNYQLHMHC
jgi:hypothetical protein